MTQETLEQLIIRAHKSAVEFKDAIRKAQTAFGGEPRVGAAADALVIQRNRIWRDIINCPYADIRQVGPDNSWHMNITIDNLTLEKIIFGANGVKLVMNRNLEPEEAIK